MNKQSSIRQLFARCFVFDTSITSTLLYLFLIGFSLLNFQGKVFGQTTISVSGIVKDTQGKPMQGVSVNIKGTSKSTITDAEGKFRIQVPSKNTLLVFRI